MANLKLKIAKAKNKNIKTGQMGYIARVVTNGKADFNDIVAEACHNTTLHKAEAKIALELCMESAARMLKQGYIVDLGPVGKLYPSCQSSWVATAEEMQLSNIKPSVYFRPDDEVEGAIKGASLAWAKEEEADDDPDGDDTPTPTPDPTPGPDEG